MVGCRKRLNRTSASAPASFSQHDLAVRAEIQAELDRDRHGDRVLDVLKDLDVALLEIGLIGQRLSAKLSIPSSTRREFRSASSRSCSSNSECSTIAPTPASASHRMPSTVCDSGDMEATSGLRSSRPHVVSR